MSGAFREPGRIPAAGLPCAASAASAATPNQGDQHVCLDRELSRRHSDPPVHDPGHAEEEIEALRARVAATRWPDEETVPDHSQGVQLATIQELARYWASDYDWRHARRS